MMDEEKERRRLRITGEGAGRFTRLKKGRRELGEVEETGELTAILSTRRGESLPPTERLQHWKSGRLVVRSGGPSVADYSEQATYGEWPKMNNIQFISDGHLLRIDANSSRYWPWNKQPLRIFDFHGDNITRSFSVCGAIF